MVQGRRWGEGLRAAQLQWSWAEGSPAGGPGQKPKVMAPPSPAPCLPLPFNSSSFSLPGELFFPSSSYSQLSLCFPRVDKRACREAPSRGRSVLHTYTVWACPSFSIRFPTLHPPGSSWSVVGSDGGGV
jgi:hypothetical protein